MTYGNPHGYGYGTPPSAGPQPYSAPQGGQPYGALLSQPQPMYRQPLRPIGHIRNPWVGLLLSLLTLGIYGIVWTYMVHDEMRAHTGRGTGGGLALFFSLFFGFIMPFVTPSDVGQMYRMRGWSPPVTGATGLWVLPGSLVPFLPLVWWFQVNNALNAYWRANGAVG